MKLKRKRHWTSRLADLLPLLLLLFSCTSAAAAQARGTFLPTGNMSTPRVDHTATLLLNGRVLITGGGRSSAELFDPATGMFTATGDMTTARSGSSATLLPDGRVLIAGGYYAGPLVSAELYDPVTGTFTATGNMGTARSRHEASLLNNGKVLITGGAIDRPESGANPELYDPIAGTFTATGIYADQGNTSFYGQAGLSLATAALLPNGNVLIAAEPTAELYDAATGTFSLTGQMTASVAFGEKPPDIEGHLATLLTNGKVLLSGGEADSSYGSMEIASAELYDPSAGNFTAVSNMTGVRAFHTATLLRDGTVLIAGGIFGPTAIASTELYVPAIGRFTATGDMTSPRVRHTATLLMDGRILITGGNTCSCASGSASAELFVPSVLVPAQVVADLRFDRTSVGAGSSYSVNISGSNLTPQTFFDVRFTAQGSNASDVVLNWQRGIGLSHDVSLDTAAGNWTINGVRSHEIETDHTGIFFSVSATITVLTSAEISSNATLTVTPTGAATTSTLGTSPPIAVGYATLAVNSGLAPYATAVYSLSQNGQIVSEAGVPASPPVQNARVFVEYRTGITAGMGTVDTYTGLAIASGSAYTASLTYTLRDRDGQTIATGHGSLPPNAHRAKFVHELQDIAQDFNLPANFSTMIQYGSLEISSNQPVSVLGLRLIINQRGEALLTSTSVADLSRPLTSSALYFPQLADGGGYTTTVILSNTSGATETGTISITDDGGAPLTVRPIDGIIGPTFSYSIPAGGTFIFKTDGSPSFVRAGWLKVTPDSGSNAPVGAGGFSYSPAGILVTESGIPSSEATTRARIYVDMSNGHDTGLAISNPAGTPITVTLQPFDKNGSNAGNGPATVNLEGGGHVAAFVGQLISGLLSGFTGVLDLMSSSPFVPLTLRSLTNGRGDFLLTTFPAADLTQPAPTPIVFPQIADGGGYTTQFIFISADGLTPSSVTVSFIDDNGAALILGPTP